ncbi:replication initiator [Streptomyces sp. URMC 129]|uniref:replication initiator n=1 Tax=Streptomyces sp. URMC 129 TaxID=3423407 RepID=UPI003F1D4BFD
MPELRKLAATGTLSALAQQLSGLGGCTRPIRLVGHRTEHHVNPATGEIGGLARPLASGDLSAGHLLTRCNNRRAMRCAACAETYRRDTYQLITAGLKGGTAVSSDALSVLGNLDILPFGTEDGRQRVIATTSTVAPMPWRAVAA